MRYLLLSFTFLTLQLSAQPDFSFHLESAPIADLGGVQSYAVASHQDRWLVVGGRLDGLHRRQPWASFDEAGNNDQLIVIDPNTGVTWSSELTGLESSIREQLSSTNMEFFQDANLLILIGGYGYSPTAQDHITHPKLTIIEVAETIEAIQNDQPFSDFVHQVEDQEFAVTGGYLSKMGDTFYLVGGQRFDGRYNPMNGPSFVQEYTNAIRRFTLSFDGDMISHDFLEEWYDEENLHRRDYNVSPQIMPDGSEAYTAFSGVFNDEDLPFLNSVDIHPSGYLVNEDFSQLFNHYHCARIPLFRASSNEMHTAFFGGMAQYYMENGLLIQDDNVPFVKSIAVVTRSGDGMMEEHLLTEQMPDLLGSGAEFIPLDATPAFPNGVIDLDALEGDSLLLGYIFGGIKSTERNIFWINDGTQSEATSGLFKVFLVQNPLSENSGQLLERFIFKVYPNPTEGEIKVDFHLKHRSDIRIEILNSDGVSLHEYDFEHRIFGAGEHSLTINPSVSPGTYLLRISAEGKEGVEKIVIKEVD